MSQGFAALRRLLPRFRIAHLFLLTFGVAAGLGIWRLSRTVNSPSDGPLTLLAPADLIAILAPLNVWVSVALLLGAWARWRVHHGSLGPHTLPILPNVLAVAWRLACAGLLIGYLFVAVDLYAIRLRSDGDLAVYAIREKWLGLSGLLLLIGMLLCHTAVRARPPQRMSRRVAWLRRPAWVRGLNRLSLLLLVLASMANNMFVYYLVLIATLGISFSVGVRGLPMERLDRTVGERVVESIPPVAATCGAIVLSVLWAWHISRRTRNTGAIPSVGIWVVHCLAMATLFGCTVYLVGVTIPKISRFIAIAFAELLDPLNTVIATCGGASLGAGLSAQIAFRSSDIERRAAATRSTRRYLRAVHLWWLLRLSVGIALTVILGLMYFADVDMPIVFNSTILTRLAAIPSNPAVREFLVFSWGQPMLWLVVGSAVAVQHLVHYLRQDVSCQPHDAAAREQLPPSVALSLFTLWWPLITLLMIVCVPLLGVLAFLTLHGLIELT